MILGKKHFLKDTQENGCFQRWQLSDLGTGVREIFLYKHFLHFCTVWAMRQYYLIKYKEVKRKEERRKGERDVLGEKNRSVHYKISGRYNGVLKIPLNYL